MAADTASSLFPNRPIRPLPKRRLRERLSPEVAESIQYPPDPRTMAPLFPYPYPLPSSDDHQDSGSSQAREGSPCPEQRQSQANGQANRQTNGEKNSQANGASDNGTSEQRSTASKQDMTIPTGPGLTTTLPTRLKSDQGRSYSEFPLPSTTSSADGDAPSENTNYKKRKIPTAGDSIPTASHTVSDVSASNGLINLTAQAAEGQNEASNTTSASYYGCGNLATGVSNVSGSGRGRYARPRNYKNQLRPMFDSTSNWSGRGGKSRVGQWTSGQGESTGIISNAIANAEKLPPEENDVSLLHQQASSKKNPASTQFTFTCDSPVPGGFSWPGSDRKSETQTSQPSASSQNQSQNQTQTSNKESWTQTSSTSQQHNGQTAPAPSKAQAQTQAQNQTQTGDVASKEAQPQKGSGQPNQHAAPQKSSRRSLAKEYLAAAKARRRETQLYNKRHPPKPEEIWICHFCEYEAIFGHPPEALVRQYEIKDRKERQLAQQRRAQWERMKKGKHKGKKSSKMSNKNNHAAQDLHHSADARDTPSKHYDDGGQDEEYYEDEYYDEEDYEYVLEEEVNPRPAGRHGDAPGHSRESSYGHDGGGT